MPAGRHFPGSFLHSNHLKGRQSEELRRPSWSFWISNKADTNEGWPVQILDPNRVRKFGGSQGGVWHKASVQIVCLWRRLLVSRHCSF